MIADMFFVRRDAEIEDDWRPRAFVAWAGGSLVAFAVENLVPQYSTALSAFIAGFVCYLVVSAGTATKRGIPVQTAKL
jgi:cytosine permease